MPKRHGGRLGVVVLSAWALVSAAAPWIAAFDPLQQNLEERLRPPSAQHFFGTDELGRDVLSRVVYGGRISVTAGVAVVAIAGIFGTTVGTIAGYCRGWMDELLMRTTDFMLGFPPVLLALATGAAFGPALSRSILALSIVWWPPYARMARGVVQSLDRREFVEATRAAGASDVRIVARTILPNAITPIGVLAVVDVANAIVAIAMFGFLGLGVQPPTPEWGAMIARGASLIDQWWVSLFPGLGMMLVITAINLVGDAARDAVGRGA
jgi:peptide/nickel transport system permease protein